MFTGNESTASGCEYRTRVVEAVQWLNTVPLPAGPRDAGSRLTRRVIDALAVEARGGRVTWCAIWKDAAALKSGDASAALSVLKVTDAKSDQAAGEQQQQHLSVKRKFHGDGSCVDHY